MSAVMLHRGPDDSGEEWFPEHATGLAHNRLSILDLSTLGHQPMRAEDGRHWIVFNGEIYNHRELRATLESRGHHFRSSSDTEVLLAAWLEWGEGCLNKLSGMFAWIIYDSLSGDLVAARDHIGIKPLYYTTKGGGLAIASEIKALLQSPHITAEMDLEALRTPARFQIAPDTGFKGIHKLPPGHLLRYRHGSGLEVKTYWQIKAEENASVSEEEAVEEMHGLLDDAVRSQMIADVPLGAFLSGGLDSSLICALMRRHNSGAMKAFTIRFSEADQKYERAGDDAHFARIVAADLGFDLHEMEISPEVIQLLPRMIWHMDEPLSDPASINTFLISQAAREAGILVLMNGVGGDEVFGGYRKHVACLQAERWQRYMPKVIRKGVTVLSDCFPVASGTQGFVYARWIKRFLSYAELSPAERYLSSDLSLNPSQYEQLFSGHAYQDSRFWRLQKETLLSEDLSYLTRMCLNDTRVFLPDHNLTYSDKASMAASIETRPPLVDPRIVERMFQMPAHLRIFGGMQKRLLKRIGERLLPKLVVHRPKASFNSPLRSWIRGPLKGVVEELLSDDRVRNRGLHSPVEVRRIIESDRAGREDWSMVIWTLLTQEIWCQTFLDRAATGPITLQS